MKNFVYQVPFKPINKKELSEIIGVSLKTLDSWLKKLNRIEFGKYKGKCFTPTQLKMIDENIAGGLISEYIKEWKKSRIKENV